MLRLPQTPVALLPKVEAAPVDVPLPAPPAQGRFGVDASAADGWSVLTLRGKLQISDAPRLHRALASAFATAARVVLELGQLTAIDPAGLELIADAPRSCVAEAGPLSVRQARPRVGDLPALGGIAVRRQGASDGAREARSWPHDGSRAATPRPQDRAEPGARTADGRGPHSAACSPEPRSRESRAPGPPIPSPITATWS
jgi:anti-anti-sigma factor